MLENAGENINHIKETLDEYYKHKRNIENK